jgi:phage FluMu protein Com
MAELQKKLTEKRCSNCNKILFKASLIVAKIEMPCPKCKTVNVWQAEQPVKHKESEGQTFAIRQIA